jgi:penicillin-binding protein 2
MIFRRFKKIIKSKEINPDEIFIDSSNISGFDKDQFEGQIEKPISHRSIGIASILFLIICFIFLFRIGNLQIIDGETNRHISENNRLRRSLVFAERGAITDRGGNILAWNEDDPLQDEFSLRKYSNQKGLHSLVGYVRYPKKDKFGFYYDTKYEGADGVERYFDSILTGHNGLKISETDAKGNIISQSVLRPAIKGENIKLSIHEKAQKSLYGAIEEISQRSGFQGGAGVVMDIYTGEVLASVTYPEYDSNVMTDGKNIEKIQSYLTNKNTPFLDRVSQGLYAPGSILKPIFALAALAEGVITPEKKIESTGEMRLPNPFRPGEFSIFKDWKAHGFTDVKEAIAVSSDVYFYQIGGGFQSQKGLGIKRIDDYAKMFGLGDSLEETFFSGKQGVIPTPEWKQKTFDGDIWRVGDTYNTVIGQYGFLVTPIQAVRFTSALANNGTLLTPTILSTETENDLRVRGIYDASKKHTKKIQDVGKISPENATLTTPDNINRWYRIIREGMRMTVTEGTMQILNVPYVEVAGKSGTAQVGVRNQFINSWSVGFFPYQNPKYAFAILLERAPHTATVGSAFAVREWLEWMNVYAPEYLKND